jgi:hypothetical protein
MSSNFRGETRPRRQGTRHHIETSAAAHHTHKPDDPFPPISNDQFPAMYQRSLVKNAYRKFMRAKTPSRGRWT